VGALWSDARYAVRTWLKAPAFALAAVATITCGAGAMTAVFSLVNAVLLRPLPYPDAERAIVLLNASRGQASRSPFVSAPRVRAWREHAQGIGEVAVYSLGPAVNVAVAGTPRQVIAGHVTASFFPFFGARLARGRAFSADEDRPGQSRVAVVSHALWQSQFRGDDTIVGQSISVNGEPATVVGVLDDRFDARSLAPDIVTPPEIWLPLQLEPETRNDANNLFAAARLNAGVSLEVARQQARAAADGFRAAFPGELPSEASFTVVPLEYIVVGNVRPSLLMLLAAVGLVALLVSANTANLFLARASARRREFAVRLAIGATRARLVRQLLTESLMLSAIGGVVGVALGILAVRLLLQLEVVQIPRVSSLGVADAVDLRVLLFVTTAVVAVGVAFGLAPAASAARIDANVERDLRSGSRGGARSGQRRAQAFLLVGEVAVACMLVIGAALLMRSLASLQRVDPGFERRGVLTMQTASGDRRMASSAEAIRVFRNGLQRLTELPGVESTAVSLTGVPLAQGGALRVDVVGRQMDRQYVANWDLISPQYFDVFGIRLIRGRLLDDRDERGMAPVAIINEAMAQQWWPDENPLGQQILIGKGGGPAFEESVPREIVGVVASVRQFGLDRAARPGVYVPIAQMADAQMSFINRLSVPATWAVRTSHDASAMATTVERELLNITALPAAEVRTMDDVFDAATASMAQNAWLMSAFGALALLIAVLGVYAAASYSVQQRTHELGVRRALGAQASQMRGMVVWESLRVVLAGTIVGMAVAVGLARLLTTLLFGVTAYDPLAFTVVPVTLVASALGGVYLPARRASTVDPVVALRE
jgi:putative ABC transport system permease protein